MRVFRLTAAHVLLATAAILFGSDAAAIPTSAVFVDGPQCDPLSGPSLVDELGIGSTFLQANEGILLVSQGSGLGFNACPATDNPAARDAFLAIRNVTTLSFQDVWWVQDLSVGSHSNWDGTVNGGQAFKIDTVGANQPLLLESLIADGIFQPNEVWEFLIQDYVGPAVGSLGSVGVPSNTFASSGSIIAVVPEPTTGLLLGLGLAGLAVMRRREVR